MYRLCLGIIFILTCSLNAAPQSQISSGDVRGIVVDTTGALIAGASVVLTHAETGLQRRTWAGESGEWSIFALAPSAYQLRVDADGFAPHTQFIRVGVGQTLSLEVRLHLDNVPQEAIVVAETPLIESERTQQSDAITEDQIQSLPINQRTFLDFALLTAGVTDSRALVTSALPQIPTSGLSVLGQGGRSNS